MLDVGVLSGGLPSATLVRGFMSDATWQKALSRLRQWTAHRVRNPHDQEDIIQDTITLAIKKEVSPSKLLSFLSKALKFKILEYTRISRSEANRCLPLEASAVISQSPNVLRDIEKDELTKRLDSIVEESLTKAEKELLLMIANDVESKVICQALNINANALRKRRQRLYEKLSGLWGKKRTVKNE